MTEPECRIVFLDAATFGDVSLQPFSSRWQCTIHPVSKPPEVRERLQGHSVAVINKVALNEAVLDAPQARMLKLIAVAATGTDNVDLNIAQKHGIRVCNVPGYATRSVAQFTLALIFELVMRAGRYGESVRAGAWQKSPIFTLHDYPTSELRGKNLGIVGYGHIGQAVAQMAQGFGLEILISARPGSPDPPPAGRIAFDELLKRSDILTLHCPLTPQTKNLFDRRAFSLMKPTAFLINTARGGLVDDQALIDVLREKKLAGAALDVLSVEPPPNHHPIIRAVRELDNLLVTPHCAWTAREARQRLLSEVLENVLAFFRGEARNLVV